MKDRQGTEIACHICQTLLFPKESKSNGDYLL